MAKADYDEERGEFPGDIVGDERCPKCGRPILYNGNYFCLSTAEGERCFIHIPPGERGHDPEEASRLLNKLLEARGRHRQ